MLFCNLTPLDGQVSFAGNQNFVSTLPLYTFQHSIYVGQFEFFIFAMKQIASICCNMSFAGQYTNQKSFAPLTLISLYFKRPIPVTSRKCKKMI